MKIAAPHPNTFANTPPYAVDFVFSNAWFAEMPSPMNTNRNVPMISPTNLCTVDNSGVTGVGGGIWVIWLICNPNMLLF